MKELIVLAVTAILIENVILYSFLGICPFLGVSNSKKSAVGMGLAVVVVVTISAVVAWLLYTFILVPFEMVYMKTIVFILVIAGLVQIMEIFIKKISPSLYNSLGIYLPLITTNCVVLGVATIVASEEYTLLKAFVYSFSTSVGFLLILFLFSAVRQRITAAPVPEGFKGVPISLITAGIMAMIFVRFAGII
ncbi:MAG: electron transport complex protein RnfA [Bacilli bacterium]|jgi:electron transport complex protein RnfA